MGYSDETWYVGSGGGGQYYPRGLWSLNGQNLIHHLDICSDWLITKKQISRVMGYSDEMWYVGSYKRANLQSTS